jgi:hypothetical protein
MQGMENHGSLLVHCKSVPEPLYIGKTGDSCGSSPPSPASTGSCTIRLMPSGLTLSTTFVGADGMCT